MRARSAKTTAEERSAERERTITRLIAQGLATRAIAGRLTTGHVLAVDRSAAAVAQAARAAERVTGGRLRVRQVAAEDLVLLPGDEPFDLVLAVRVGALDGRAPELGRRVLRRLAAVTRTGARLFVDGGDPLREVTIPADDG